jgi:hypothetical protein
MAQADSNNSITASADTSSRRAFLIVAAFASAAGAGSLAAAAAAPNDVPAAVLASDPNPQKAGEIMRWTKGYWEAVHPYSADGGYVNFMMDDGDDSRLKATYGDNYDRLVALKDKYDPTNFFRVNQNIRPLHS